MIQIPIAAIAITIAYTSSLLFEHLEIMVWYEAKRYDGCPVVVIQ